MPLPTHLESLGQLLVRHRSWVLGVWLLVVLLLKLQAPAWESVAIDGDLEHLPAYATVVRGEKLSQLAFPDERAKSQLVLIFARQDGVLTLKDRELAYHCALEFEQLPGPELVDVWTEKTPVVGTLLRSRSGHAVRVVVRLTNEFMATDNIGWLQAAEKIVQAARQQAHPGLEIGITGSAAIGGDMLTAAAESVANTHLTTLLLVTIVLFLIYRSPWLVLVPLITIGVAASTSLDLLALLAQQSATHPDVWPTIRLFTTTKIFVIVLLFGAGTDYCLFLTARFCELRSEGLDPSQAIIKTLGCVGVALLASALTTILGLAMMGWAEFGKFTYSGPAIAICLAITLLVCLTLVPALLATRLGTRVTAHSQSSDKTWWNWLADCVLRRPGTVLALSLLLMFPLAWGGWSVEVTYDLLGELPPQRVSRQGTQLLRQHTAPGEIGPLVVLAQHPTGDLDSMDGQFVIAEMVQALYKLPGVAQVRSLYQPTGDPPGSVRLFSSEGLTVQATKGSPLAKAVFVSPAGPLRGKVTRLFLILQDEPFSARAVQTCNLVEQALEQLCQTPDSSWQGATFELIGPTAGIRDLARVTHRDQQKIQVLVAGVVLLVILLLLRQPVVCCYLIATVVFSYLVTLGITDLSFHALRGEAYQGLDWKVPLFLFVILVAVGQDYNIYLVTRVLEEQRKRGAIPGLRYALVQTGGIITSCGLIMAGTFVSMLTAQMHGMVELGFALTLGILLDTFVVRTLLVPAFLALRAEPVSPSANLNATGPSAAPASHNRHD
jgi:RND superfamily putative drug exporter